MKKIFLILLVIVIGAFLFKNCHNDDIPITGYEGRVVDVKGNVLCFSSGISARLLGVENGRTDVEMFLRSQYLDKNVVLVSDSKSQKQTVSGLRDTLDAYVNEKGVMTYCINRIVAMEYPDSYRELETSDSTGWVKDKVPTIKKNLALYMKQRTFLIQTPEGLGTGFFINDKGLAVTNWHVLAPEYVENSKALLYEDDPDDSNIYSSKVRKFNTCVWSSDVKGLDITIVKVQLETGEKVPYFDIAKKHPNQGDKVSTFGNPHGLTASYSSGVISAFRKDPYNPERNVDLIQYDMSTNGGNSGGPVCDIYGQIIAVHELGDKSAQNINYGIDAMQLRMVLDKLGLQYGGK